MPLLRMVLLVVVVGLLGACGTPTASLSPQTTVVEAPIATAAPATAESVTAMTEDTMTAADTATVDESITAMAPASATTIILVTTTSTQDSGLLDVLIPRFEEQTDYTVRTIAVGSGAAIAMGERGEADVVLAHAPENERSFVASGAGIDRTLVMYNDFIVVGPTSDPAAIKDAAEIVPAMQTLAESGSLFISRGDNSGTNQLELSLWEAAAVEPQGQSWYIESGTGMGQTLQIADEREAYTLTDRATFLAWQERVELETIIEGDAALLNIYHVIVVNPERFDRVNQAGARAFIDFLVADETQALIEEFGRDVYGQSLFTPCANNSCGLANNGD